MTPTPRLLKLAAGALVAVAALTACRKEVPPPTPMPTPDQSPKPKVQTEFYAARAGVLQSLR